MSVPGPAAPAPATSAITPAAQSAVQSCLGDTLAQTILGPATMGARRRARRRAGARAATRPPACSCASAARRSYIRHIHAMEQRARARASATAERRDRRARDRRARDRRRRRRRRATCRRASSCGCSPAAASCARSPGAEPFTEPSHTAVGGPASCRADPGPEGRRMTIDEPRPRGLRSLLPRSPWPASRRRRHRTRPAQLAAKIDASKPQERDPARRRRHGRLRGHARPLLRQGRRRAAEHGPAARSAAARSTTCCARAPGPTYQPNYVGDSAPTATAWSTGKRTQDGRLSQGPSAADNVPGPNAGYTTYMELARDAGKATGNVSTAEITDATPAAPSSHISQRACQGPADTRTTCPTEAKTAAQPGLGSIAEQQVDEGFDLYLGGGRARYEQPLTAGGTDERHRLRAGPRATRTSTPSRRWPASPRSSGGKKVLGLFNRRQHDDRVRAAVRPHRGVLRGQPEPRRAGPGRQRDDALPAAEPRRRAVAAGDDDQGALAARGRQGRLRAAGRGRLDRQARPRRRRLRPDRRDARVRQRRSASRSTTRPSTRTRS